MLYVSAIWPSSGMSSQKYTKESKIIPKEAAALQMSLCNE
jgi:hypothetical protein